VKLSRVDGFLSSKVEQGGFDIVSNFVILLLQRLSSTSMFLPGVIRRLTSFGSMLFVFVYIQKMSEGSSHVLGHIFHFYFRVFLEYVENPVKGTVRKSVW
jgi:hypothetical protein